MKMPAPTVDAIAAALLADGGAPIKARVAGVCVLHRRRYRLRRWLPDTRTVQRGYALRQAEVRTPVAAYARRGAP